MQLNTHVTAWAQAATWLTFLSVSPSLDFIGVGADVDAGVDVGADADVGAGLGAVGADADAVVVGVGFGAGVAGVAVAAATAATATAAVAAAAIAVVVPAVSFDLGASRAFNAGPGVGPMSIVVKRWKVIGKWSPVQMGMRLAMARATPFRLEMAMR